MVAPDGEPATHHPCYQSYPSMAARSHRSRSRRLARRVASGLLNRLARTADAIADRIEPSQSLRAWLHALSPAEREPARDPPPATVPNGAWAVADPEATTLDARQLPPTVSPAAEAPDGAVGTDGSDALSVSAHLSDRVGPCIETLAAAAAWRDRTPSPEDLRALRVASRRLRAFVVLFAPQLGEKHARRLNRRLRKITRALGPVRDGQAVVALLQATYDEADEAENALERAALEHLLVQLRREQRPALREGLDALRQAQLRPLAEQLGEALDRVCGGLVRAGPRVHAYAWRALGPRADNLLASIPPRDLAATNEALHELRIAAKRLRYTLEMVRPLLGSADATTRRVAKKVQRSLGEHRDATQLRALMTARAASLAADGHTTLARALSERATRLGPRCAAALKAAAPWVVGLDPQAIERRLRAIFNPDAAGDRSGDP